MQDQVLMIIVELLDPAIPEAMILDFLVKSSKLLTSHLA